MRFLADMGISRKTVTWLRNNGHDAVHLLDERLHKLPDKDVLEKARKEKRILLTMDLDFGYLLAISKQDMPSIIILRLKNETYENINKRLTDVLRNLDKQLIDGNFVISVEESKIRYRSLSR